MISRERIFAESHLKLNINILFSTRNYASVANFVTLPFNIALVFRRTYRCQTFLYCFLGYREEQLFIHSVCSV